MITCDLHLHTNFSDGRLTVSKLVDLYGHAGFDAIAITDHLCVPSTFLGFGAKVLKRTLSEQTWHEYQQLIEKEKNRAWRDYKMIVFPGVEYTCNTFDHQKNVHILAIDLTKYVPPYRDEIQWLNEVISLGTLTVAAHPLKLKDASSQTYYLIENAEKLSPYIHAWEVANHKTLWKKMLKTPFSLIASSDFHDSVNWAAWRTRIHCEKDPEAIKAFFKNPNLPRQFVFTAGPKDEVLNVCYHRGAIDHDPVSLRA